MKGNNKQGNTTNQGIHARTQQALRAPEFIRKKRFQFLPETEMRIESVAFWTVKPWRVFAEDHSLARQKQYGSLCH